MGISCGCWMQVRPGLLVSLVFGKGTWGLTGDLGDGMQWQEWMEG